MNSSNRKKERRKEKRQQKQKLEPHQDRELEEQAEEQQGGQQHDTSLLTVSVEIKGILEGAKDLGHKKTAGIIANLKANNGSLERINNTEFCYWSCWR